MKRMLLLLAFVLLAAPPLPAAESLTLTEALATARANQPQLAGAREAVAGAEARTGQSLAAYYPHLDLTADWSKGRTYLTPLQAIRETELYSSAVNLHQTLYDFGRTAGTVATAREEATAAREGLAATGQEVDLRVKAAFYLLLAAEKQLAVLDETVRARRELYRQAAGFYAEGLRPKLDETRAEADLFSAESDRIRAENNRSLARVELATAMGLTDPIERPLTEPGGNDTPPAALAALKQQALAARPELKQLLARHRAAQGSVATARSGHLPILTATASSGYAARDFPPDGAIWSVGVNVTVPLFSGFSTVERVREAVAARRATEAQLHDLQLRISGEVEAAWLAVREARARLVSTGKEREAARESLQLATGRYREGVGTIIEMTDAQARALAAETAVVQAGYDCRIAEARLDRAVGNE